MKKHTIWMSIAGILLTASFQSTTASETTKVQSNTPSKGIRNSNISKTTNSGEIPKYFNQSPH
ncbi:MAG: hypothetical protein IPM69_01450 [Ignavibacteria bacterium]|nr:hypothetical protein [Ignavibacteria bacterium]